MFIAYVVPERGMPFHLPPFGAADMVEARTSARRCATDLLGPIPYTYTVRPT